MTNGPAQFRKLLADEKFLVLPGIFNALFARVMERAGFPCIYMSGFAVATTALGLPDLGMLGLSEMAEQARRIVNAVAVPVLADADTGYGGVFSIRRTVQEYEQAGLAGMHLEDQELTVKRCGHLADVAVISAEQMVRRIRAALHARRNDDFFVIARTDCRRVLGFEEALRRVRMYAAEGADAVFVEYLTNPAEIARVVETVRVPVVTVVAESDHMISAADVKRAGAQIAIFPISVLNATVHASQRVAQTLRQCGTTQPLLDHMVARSDLLEYIRYKDMAEFELGTAAQECREKPEDKT